MITYSKKDYSTFDDFAKDANEVSARATAGIKVNSAKYGSGQVVNAYLPEVERDKKYADLYLNIRFSNNENKTFSLRSALSANSLSFNSADKAKLTSILTELKPSIDLRLTELDSQYAEETAKMRADREAKLAEIKRKKAEAKALIRREQALAKLQKLEPENTKKLFSSPVSYFETIGWMAKHCKSVKASMPDWMENQFISMFGDVERYVVDSKKKTSGGYSMQWGLGLKITFDKEVSGALTKRATSKNKKVIDNVAFIWDLVANYGFKFGKKQDANAILEEVPAEYIDDFKRGYSM